MCCIFWCCYPFYEKKLWNTQKILKFAPSPPFRRSPSQQIYVFRRACIRRSGNCDHKPSGCCANSSCRCNLWGSNCRCQRMVKLHSLIILNVSSWEKFLSVCFSPLFRDSLRNGANKFIIFMIFLWFSFYFWNFFF